MADNNIYFCAILLVLAVTEKPSANDRKGLGRFFCELINMATIKQKQVAKMVVDKMTGKSKLTGQKMLEKVGYSRGIARHSGRVFRSTGVKLELKKYGFDEETAKQVVVDILVNSQKEENRLRAAEQVFRVCGSYSTDKNPQTSDEMEEAIARIRSILPPPAK
jgi:hypothetical protein